ncbi:MAG: electron transfer flavoprotein subunit alpha/FixB family protein [Candidatus Promineifilaceae bacterium]|nr:electron transfer flavoprotein subunit alpha/FixB family protein [Candidatus Promineifilaceae bacterium]
MILTVIEHDGDKIESVSLEMLTVARGLAEAVGGSLGAVLVGGEARPLADHLPAYGVSTVHLVEHERLRDYAPEAWARSVAQLAERLSPEAIVGPGTDRGNEVLAHLGAVTWQPMAANCTEVRPGDNGYEVTRVRWGGSLLEEARLSGAPKLLTVAPHVVEAEQAATAPDLAVETFAPELDDKAFRVQVTERVETAEDKISLAEARIVIGGGRGVGSEEGFEVLEELADLLGGAVGGSRVVTNLGWRPHADQIGQTGTRIAPDLYIACGISGAIQHMVGCKGAKQILAINSDREAPIMSKADYAVVADLHEVLPALVDEVKKAQS